MSASATLTAANFDEEVLLSETPVLVDFFATWCGPCRSLAPTIAQIEQERAGKLRVLTCDIDQQPALAERFSVMGVPTLMLFKGGRVVETLVGARPKAQLLAAIDGHLD
jgi:thioredoxin 1